jgi:two-component system, chemotaxis family, chemotaxis protein CheY
MENVLIVDDSKLMRTAIQKMVERLGLTVVGVAVDGVEAIEKYKELKPDIVTLDLTMPELDGEKCILEMMKYKSDSKIIVVSALKDDKTRNELIEKGAFAYIPKPLREESLREILNQITGAEV